ncbi:MAG: hypothetical protein ABIL09_18995, partial [Gemmatimonadota bacterium]
SSIIAVLVLCWPLAGHGQAAAAFISEVSGEVVVSRASGTSERALVGQQLAAGDSVKVARGQATVIYLSGRAAKVGPGTPLVVAGQSGQSSPLLARISATLGEMSSPTDNAGGPSVHGMARDLGIAGARPMNSLLLDGSFRLRWEPGETAGDYVVTIGEAGSNGRRTVTTRATMVSARDLGLTPGKRYVWSVQTADGILTRTSGEGWIEIAPDSLVRALKEDLAAVGTDFPFGARTVMQAALCHERGFDYEAESLLEQAAALDGMAYPTRALLNSVRATMGAGPRP